MSYELNGKLYHKTETQQKTETFKVREFVVEQTETSSTGKEYTNLIKLQASQDRTALLDSINIGDQVAVNFNLRGSKSVKDGKTYFFNNLDAWKIEVTGKAEKKPAITDAEVVEETVDDLPF